MSIRKDDMAKVMKLDVLGAYDCALPQQWLDDLTDKIVADKVMYPSEHNRSEVYDVLISGLVWFYPKDRESGFSIFGYPFPLTPAAAEYLKDHMYFMA